MTGSVSYLSWSNTPVWLNFTQTFVPEAAREWKTLWIFTAEGFLFLRLCNHANETLKKYFCVYLPYLSSPHEGCVSVLDNVCFREMCAFDWINIKKPRNMMLCEGIRQIKSCKVNESSGRFYFDSQWFRGWGFAFWFSLLSCFRVQRQKSSKILQTRSQQRLNTHTYEKLSLACTPLCWFSCCETMNYEITAI